MRPNFSHFHTVSVKITEIYSHSDLFWQKFRENNDFTNKIIK